MSDDVVFGIDLGTTFCSCARASSGSISVEALPVDDGQQLSLPSVLYLVDRGEQIRCYAGRRAQQEDLEQRQQGVLAEFAKRYIGQPPGQSRSWSVGAHAFDPVEISALILRKIKKEVDESDPSQPLRRAVVSHPRDFKMPSKEATAQAVALAGIELIETINEPEAAAYMYFEPGGEREPGYYLIFDLGGGTLDIAVLEVPLTGRPKVLGGCGVATLGGKDWDDAMLEELLLSAEQHHAQDSFQYRTDISDQTAKILRKQAREWKENALRRGVDGSWSKLVVSRLQDGGEVQTPLRVTVADWERRCRPLVEKCDEAIDRALKDVGRSAGDILRVLPVGGSVRLRAVRELLARRFDARVEPIDRDGSLSVDLAVAQGAARFAAFCEATRASKAGAGNGKPAVASSMLRLIEDAAPATSLPHGLNVLSYRPAGPGGHGQERPFLECLVPKGAPLPFTQTRQFQVIEPGQLLRVDLYEGPPGELPSGVMVSASILFSSGLQARAGDVIDVTVQVGQSSRITVEVVHHRSGEKQLAELRVGGGAAVPRQEAVSRQARLAAVEVI